MRNSLMKKKLFGFIVVSLVLLICLVGSKDVSAAGTAKPAWVNSEVEYDVINVYGSSNSGGTAADCGLFDGTTVNEWDTSNVMYWREQDNFVELNIKDTCNIWRCGTASWPDHIGPLKIWKFDNDKYIDVTSLYTQTITGINQNQWEKTITNLQPGKYKFSTSSPARLDSEWYLESVKINSTPVTNLVATAGGARVDLTWDSVPNITNYKIKRSTTAGGPYDTIISSGTATTATDTNVQNGITYYYIVTAVLNGNEGTNSNEVSAIPKSDLVTSLKVVLEPKEILQLSVDEDIEENTKLIWTSSNTSVATVDGNGEVTAIKKGNTVITVKNESGTKIETINILVIDDADEYRLAVDLRIGKKCRLTIDDFTNAIPVSWASMDSSVATISSKGKVTAVSKGLVLMTATDSTGNIIGQVYVRVRA